MWFQAKAEEAERSRHLGKLVWRGIRDMQHARRGLVPCRSMAIKDYKGNPTTTLVSQHHQWRHHFMKVLNIQSEFDETEIKKAKQRELQTELAGKPSADELAIVLKKLKDGKAGKRSSILPEIVKVARGDDRVFEFLLDLLHTTWEEKRVPKEWADAVNIPISKRGGLSQCDNWRGIALLEVVGEAIARIL